MDGHPDETGHVISLGKFESNKRYKEQILQEIIAAICAMLNSNGGNVVAHMETDSNDIPGGFSFSQMSLLIRILEQSMISIIGLNQLVSKINFKEDNKGIIIFVKKAESLITINYYLYLPSETQVVQVFPLEPLEKVKDVIINRKVVLKQVQLGSHFRTFFIHEHCALQDSKFAQLKHLKASSSKRTTLSDRMTGKGNKFSSYVSAFANYSGGHMYFGIKDDGVVAGEFIPNEKDKNEITKKVQRVLDKMIWPQHIGQPKRGVQWEIFFEPVVDENSKPIPSTVVIVIYIAPCLGGVFTEEPECYEMVQGKVQKMSFITWKIRILQPIKLCDVDNLSSKIKHITWSSTGIRNVCVVADQLLTKRVDNGKSIQTISTYLEETFKYAEVRLVVLSKKVMVSYRSGCFRKAENLLHEYGDLLMEATETGIFDALRVYLQTAFYRARGNVRDLRYILADALAKAEIISPGLISAALYLLTATVTSLFQAKDDKVVPSPDDLSILALEHLQYVQDSPIVRADMEQKAHITLALLYLGCNISGELTKKDIESESLEKAKSSIMAVRKSIDEGNLLNIYREIQFILAQSVLFYRCSQVQCDRKVSFLKEGFDLSKRAECLASKHKFTEMLNWARACTTVCTADLVLTNFQSKSGIHSQSTSEIHSDFKTHPNTGIHSESKTHPKSEIHSEFKTHPNLGIHCESKTHPKSEIHSESKTHPKSEIHSKSKLEIHSEFRTHPMSEIHSEFKTHPKSEIHSEFKTHPNPGIHCESKTHPKWGNHSKSKTHPKRKIHSESKTYCESKTKPPQKFVIEINEEAGTSKSL